MSIPQFFRCPISLDIFSDPVTLSTGQTYDRASIEKWLDSGNLTCPVTMQKLQDTTLVPNHTLRHLINKWLFADTSIGYQFRKSETISDTELSLFALKQHLLSKHTSNVTRFEALKKVRILSVESDFGKACLIKLGFFQVLLQMLFQCSLPFDLEFIEVVLDCMLSLSPSTHFDSLNMLKQRSNLSSLILLIDRGNAKIKTSLCYLLEAVASSSMSNELCTLLGQQQRIWQVLVVLLKDKFNNCTSEAAVCAISSLCSSESNRDRAINHGAVDSLIAYLSNSNRRNSWQALSTLELLLQLESGKRAFIENCDAIKVLIKMIFRVSAGNDGHKGSEHAVGSLFLICLESAKIRVEAVNAGILTQLLLLLQSQCNTKAKTKARSLLKLLRTMWNEDSSREISQCQALAA